MNPRRKNLVCILLLFFFAHLPWMLSSAVAELPQTLGQPGQMPVQPSVQQGMPHSFPGPSTTPTGIAPSMVPCTVKISTDRSTVHLMDPASGMERKHVSLRQDRMQKIFNSPDGAWSVAIFKVRGELRYGALTLNLFRCEEQEVVEVPSVPVDAVFGPEEAVLLFEGGTRLRLTVKNNPIP